MRQLILVPLFLVGCSSTPSELEHGGTDQGVDGPVATTAPASAVAPAPSPPPWPSEGNLLTIASGDASEVAVSSKGGDLVIHKLAYTGFARRVEPLASGEPKGANVSFESVTADGLVMRDVRCRLGAWSYSDEEMEELVTSGKIVGVVLPDAIAAAAAPAAKAKELRACAQGVSPRVGWIYSVHLVQGTNVLGVAPDAAACIEKELNAVSGPVEDGACVVSLEL